MLFLAHVSCCWWYYIGHDPAYLQSGWVHMDLGENPAPALELNYRCVN